MLSTVLVLLAHAAAAHPTPFQITNNKTFVQVRVNASAPQWFILDTGNNSPSLIDRECADRLQLKRGAEESIQMGAGSGAATGLSQAHQAIHLEALGETLTVAEPVVLTLGHVSRIEGRRVDGLLGADFLARHVLEIDYARSTMTIRDPAGYEPPNGAIVLPLDLDTGWPVVAGKVTTREGNSLQCHLIVDTGMRGSMTLFRPFAERNGLHESASLHDFVFGAGAGGLTRGDIGRVKSISLGSRSFDEPVVSFARDTTGIFSLDGPDGIIGGELLRRNRVTFDCLHQRMILEPYAEKEDPFESDMSGLFLQSEAPDYQAIRIVWVNPKTPAADAGLMIGDEIVSIDGARAPKLSLDEARGLLRKPVTRRLEIRRKDRAMQVRLEAHRLV